MSETTTIPDYIHESVRALPVLPTAVTRLLTLARDVNVDFREIARVIETDQTLTARTLRAANSPLNAVSRRVKTVRQATVLLGTDTIVNLVLGISVISLQSGLYKNLPIDPVTFGRHSIAVALTARTLAKYFGLNNPSEAFVAGLLHDIGKLVLLMHFGEAYAQLMREARQGNAPLNELELDVFDLDHALVGHVLCMHWNLPLAMTQAVAEHHADPAPRTLAEMVSRSNDLVKTIQLGDSANRYIAPSLQEQPRDQVSPGIVRELVRALPRLTQQAEEALGHKTTEVQTPDGPCPPVQLHVKATEHKEILAAMLWSMGYEPVSTCDASFATNGHTPVALFTDAPEDDSFRSVFQQHDIPVFDWVAWREGEGLAPSNPGNVYRLREWLGEGLTAAVTTSE